MIGVKKVSRTFFWYESCFDDSISGPSSIKKLMWRVQDADHDHDHDAGIHHDGTKKLDQISQHPQNVKFCDHIVTSVGIQLMLQILFHWRSYLVGFFSIHRIDVDRWMQIKIWNLLVYWIGRNARMVHLGHLSCRWFEVRVPLDLLPQSRVNFFKHRPLVSFKRLPHQQIKWYLGK